MILPHDSVCVYCLLFLCVRVFVKQFLICSLECLSVLYLCQIIDVGGKEFRFTWSKDGDLCDIYEERRSGEDGNGLLVESGCAWRKLNVQRVLDESTKNHVKRRSEEAERKMKSRKYVAIIGDIPYIFFLFSDLLSLSLLICYCLHFVCIYKKVHRMLLLKRYFNIFVLQYRWSNLSKYYPRIFKI